MKRSGQIRANATKWNWERFALAVSPTYLRNLMGSWVGALLGACFYGAIVAAVNWNTGWAHATRSGLGHAFVSAALTLFGTGWMRLVFKNSVRSPHRIITTFIAGMALTYLLLISIHLLLATPRLLLSLMPGFLPNVLFCATYSRLLAHAPMQKPLTPNAMGAMPPPLRGCMS